MEDVDLNELVSRAQAGDAEALEHVVRAVQDDVFDLAVRMLGDVTDARDASQEVLVRVVTKLGSFRGDSRFRTWVYRVAANALLNFRSETRRRETSFDEAEEQLQAALAAGSTLSAGAPDETLVNEVKLVCAHGMLLNLDRAHRLTYVLGEVLELDSDEGARVVEVSPAAFRKRLSRAREAMEEFLRKNCGVANPRNACRCAKLAPAAEAAGLVDPKRLVMRRLPTRETDRLQLDVERLRSAAEIFRSLPRYALPSDFAEALRDLLASVDGRGLLAEAKTSN